MIACYHMFFSMLTNLFAAGDNGASSLKHITKYLDETAESFSDKARIERLATLKQLTAE